MSINGIPGRRAVDLRLTSRWAGGDLVVPDGGQPEATVKSRQISVRLELQRDILACLETAATGPDAKDARRPRGKDRRMRQAAAAKTTRIVPKSLNLFSVLASSD